MLPSHSADDHDYCEYTHNIPLVEEGPEARIHSVREVTVKSFSMAMGITRPGFQLLSLSPGGTTRPPAVADSPCLLPNQLAIYLERYVPLLVFSLVALVVSSVRQTQDYQHGDSYMSLPIARMNGGRSNRRESAVWATLSPESHPSPLPSPSEDLMAGSRSLRVPKFRNGYGDGKLSPATPTFRASSPSAAQLDSPMFFSGLGIAVNGTNSGGPGEHDDELGAEEEGVAAILPEAQYARWKRSLSRDRSRSIDGLPRPSGSRYDNSDLKWRWSKAFPFRSRWRRITIGVPPTLERLIRKALLSSSYSDGGDKTVLRVFWHQFLGVVWIPFGLFFFIVYIMFS